MKTLIDLTSLADNFSGIERFAMNIAREMIRHSKDDSFILVFKNEIHESFTEYAKMGNVRAIVLKGTNKLIFNQVTLPIALYRNKADRYLFLAFPDPILFFNKNIYTTIHDLGCWDCPDSMTTTSKLYFQFSYRKSMRFSKQIFTVSQFSKNRINLIGNVPSEKVKVIYNGIGAQFSRIQCKDVLEKYRLPNEYVLSLSTLEPRKNLSLLIESYARLLKAGKVLPELVLAGRKGWKMEDFLKDYTDDVLRHLHFTGFIDDCDLSEVYSHASWFIFPTKYEGFGIPPLEAMACGTPVISSNAASMPEVLGDAALFFESNDSDSLAQRMKEAFSMSDDDKSSLIHRGLIQVKKFSWETEALKILDTLKLEE